MEIKEKALRLHEEGFNCAQSVLGACGEYTGIDDKTALALGGGLGGGVRCGEICGALTGAVLAVGASKPFSDADDMQAKVKIATLTKECVNLFNDKFGCKRCFELKASGHPCKELIGYCAELAEQVIISDRGE